MVKIVTCLFMGKKIYKFKANNKSANFPTQFCLGSISNKFGTINSRKVPLEGNLNNFTVNYRVIEKSGVQIENFGKETPQVHLIFIREWPKTKPPPPHPL